MKDIIHICKEDKDTVEKHAEMWKKSSEEWQANHDKISEKLTQERNALLEKLMSESKYRIDG